MNPTSRELLFFNRSNFELYRQQQEARGYTIITISEFLRGTSSANELDAYAYIVDISAITTLGADIQYNGELFINRFDEDVTFIADESKRDLLVFELRYCFASFGDIVLERGTEMISSDDNVKVNADSKSGHTRVVDLCDDQIMRFLERFSNELYGHDKFKDEFKDLITNFRIFNKLGEHKILSLFLMGESGVGKTEVARAIHKSLGGKSKLAKINFGNYSSDNSLNSLIGSPRGYNRKRGRRDIFASKTI
ncbi:sigma 54-interacting transcriptional regulator [Dyadobacter alkalitolerans]|uniref:sigma 54-interacting transcriptional regulator n=1 Tax=Dyadobacter alkalitolerans TaxID=492736 RepID=UPI000404D2E0|nr:sigma 54-interacting transcriptional regulator [Dyadobacter alkalitolerans]